MQIPFSVAGGPASFTWDSWSGRAELTIGQEQFPLQSPTQLSTHFGLGTTRTWLVHSQGHQVEIVKTRPTLFAGFRAHQVTIRVDGAIVAEQNGH